MRKVTMFSYFFPVGERSRKHVIYSILFLIEVCCMQTQNSIVENAQRTNLSYL
jgi:hypothetical protein